MQIDKLTYSVGKVIYTNYAARDKPMVQSFEINIKNKTYQNITSAQQLIALLLTEAMKQTTIKGAAIYGVSAILSVGFLPAGVVGALIGKDSSRSEFKEDYEKVYNVSLEVIKQMGKLLSENRNGRGKAILFKYNMNAEITETIPTLQIVNKGE